MSDPYVTVVVLTRNGLPLVEKCLRALLVQETPLPFEVLVIDSNSTDGTLELAKSLPVRIISIQPHEFNHGDTRNLGAHEAKGQFVVNLVQDAVPVDTYWLAHLVAAAESENTAGSYGRELPRPADTALVRLHMAQALVQEAEPVRQALPADRAWSDLTPWERFRLASFRDTCSCLRREVWQAHPYRRTHYGEDLEWGKRVIQAGYALEYEPRAAVYHSHDRSSWYVMKRSYADHELVMRLFELQAYPRLRGLVASWLRVSWQLVQGTYRDSGSRSQRLVNILRAPVLTAARHGGSYLGAQAAQRNTTGFFWRKVDGVMRQGV
jgi:rhamnosyltransferase